MSPIIYGQICMITFCREQLRIVKQPGLIWKQPTKIDWQKWVLITMPCLLTTAEFNFHGLNITKITQKWIHSCGFSIRWERQALEHCNCVLYWLTNSFLQKKKKDTASILLIEISCDNCDHYLSNEKKMLRKKDQKDIHYIWHIFVWKSIEKKYMKSKTFSFGDLKRSWRKFVSDRMK